MALYTRNKPSVFPLYVIMLLYIGAVMNNDFGMQNLLYTKLCYEQYHNLSLCSVQTFGETHPDLQADVSRWSIYMSVVQVVPAILSNIVLSSYCDRVAHKLPLYFAIIGVLMQAIWLAICSYSQFIGWPPYTLFLAVLLYGLSGSYVMVIMSGMSYIALVAPLHERPFFLALAEASYGIGTIIASSSQGPFISTFGMFVFFLYTAAIGLLAALLTIFLMVDIKKPEYDTAKLADLFKLDRLIDSITAMFQPRENGTRKLAHLGFAIFFMIFWSVISTDSVDYLYLIKEMGLSLNQYSLWNSIKQTLRGVMTPITLLIFHRLMKVGYFPLTMLGVTSGTLYYLVLSMRSNLVNFIIAIFLGSLQPKAYSLLRSYQTTLIPQNDLGEMFAYEGILKVLINFLSALFGKTVYMWTVSWWAGLTYAISAAVGLGTMVLVTILERYTSFYGSSEARLTVNTPSE